MPRIIYLLAFGTVLPGPRNFLRKEQHYSELSKNLRNSLQEIDRFTYHLMEREHLCDSKPDIVAESAQTVEVLAEYLKIVKPSFEAVDFTRAYSSRGIEVHVVAPGSFGLAAGIRDQFENMMSLSLPEAPVSYGLAFNQVEDSSIIVTARPDEIESALRRYRQAIHFVSWKRLSREVDLRLEVGKR